MQYAYSHAYFFKVLVSVRFYRHKCYNFQGLKMLNKYKQNAHYDKP